MMDVTESPVLNVTISLLETVNESTPVVESIGGMNEELFNMTNPTMHTSLSLYCEMYNRNITLKETQWTTNQMIWTILFSLIIVIAIVGNAIVLWIILAHRSMWSVTNYFLFNLTLADLMMATLNCIPSFIFMRDRVWRLGSVYCKVNTFLSYVTVPASVFTLLAITIDRRKAIVKPLEPKTPKWRVLVSIFLIWLLSSIIALPPTIVTKHFKYTTKCDRTRYMCVPLWSSSLDDREADSKYDHIYNVMFTMVTYITPMLGMGACYVQIGRNLWGGEVIGELLVHPAVLKSKQNKKRVVVMFAIVISIFMVCWLPYQLYFLTQYYLPDLRNYKYIGDVYLSFYWLAMANSCVNPIIYYWMNARFRGYFNAVLLCIPRNLRKLRLVGSRKERHTSFNHANNTRNNNFQDRFDINLPVRAVGMLESRSKDGSNGGTTHINGFVAEHSYTGTSGVNGRQENPNHHQQQAAVLQNRRQSKADLRKKSKQLRRIDSTGLSALEVKDLDFLSGVLPGRHGHLLVSDESDLAASGSNNHQAHITHQDHSHPHLNYHNHQTQENQSPRVKRLTKSTECVSTRIQEIIPPKEILF